MGYYTNNLPQLNDKLCITDGGLETTLCFHHKIDLPEFASYDLLRTASGYQTLVDYYRGYGELAKRHGVGIILETPTWRSNRDWGAKIGDSPEQLDAFNRQAVKLLEGIRAQYQSPATPVVISGCLGPRGDGYRADNRMSADAAKAYHSEQLDTFASTNVDMVAALTLNYVEEAIGITQAAQARHLPVCISFTVETDGRLPTGQSLGEAIEAVDQATDKGPAYYMINCAHPTHFDRVLAADAPWIARLKGIRGNASRLSHAQLDESEHLDEGNPAEFGRECRDLRQQLPHLAVLGGCCGTDLRHIDHICLSLRHSEAA